MNSSMSKMNRVFEQVKGALGRLLIFIFTLLVADVLWQVLARYVLNTAFSFTEELARFEGSYTGKYLKNELN